MRQRHLTGGIAALPFGSEDIRRVKAAVLDVSERRSCRVLHVGRASLHRTREAKPRRGRAAPTWLERWRYWIQHRIIERFFRSLKEECVWQQVFQTFEEARRVIGQ